LLQYRQAAVNRDRQRHNRSMKVMLFLHVTTQLL